MVVGYHHFRKPPYGAKKLSIRFLSASRSYSLAFQPPNAIFGAKPSTHFGAKLQHDFFSQTPTVGLKRPVLSEIVCLFLLQPVYQSIFSQVPNVQKTFATSLSSHLACPIKNTFKPSHPSVFFLNPSRGSHSRH